MTTAAPASKAVHYSLWAVQVLLALAFGMAGVMKSTVPIDELAKQMVWPGAVPAGLVRFIGVSEFLGAVGLILPAATRIQPKLTGVAGAALALVMVLAAGFHATRAEYPGIVFNAVLGGLAAFVAWGRLSKAPIAPR